MPGDIAGLAPGQQRYTQFTDDAGGILDDLMVTSTGDHLLVVVNAACKDADLAHMQSHLSGKVEIEAMFSRGLLALQGPQASAVLGRFVPQVATMKFMTGAFFVIEGARCYVTRSGYTGCDGYEISTPVDATDPIARKLLGHPEVKPIGLGARDTLRLEAGMPLYGNELHRELTPYDVGLGRIVKLDKPSDFVGGSALRARAARGDTFGRRLVGLRMTGRGIARRGYDVRLPGATPMGTVTSGTHSPSLGYAIALADLDAGIGPLVPGAPLEIGIRGEWVSAEVAGVPFIQKRSTGQPASGGREQGG